MKNKKIELKRVNMNLPSYIVNAVKDYAYDIGIPITQAYVIILSRGLYSFNLKEKTKI